MHLLFVCTGNVGRSPMAEMLQPIIIPDASLTSSSAGIRGLPSHPMEEEAAELMRSDGIDPSRFRSRRITPSIAGDADLILCFEQRQRREIATIAPQSARHTFLLNDFAHICAFCAEQGYLPARGSRTDRMAEVIANASMIRPMIPGADDIEDPHLRSHDVFVRVHDLIVRSLRTIGETTAPLN